MYATGEELHVAIWPGNVRNTADITRFVAREGRVFVLSASSLLRRSDLPSGFPLADALPPDEWFNDGGSAIAGPDGQWLAEPEAHRSGLVMADVDLASVGRERQNFDPTGHYSRPDVFKLDVQRRRLLAANFVDEVDET
jgi:nitrilase